MTSSQLLLPLRIPEVGPSLGKIVTGTGRDPGGLELDMIRHRLTTRVFEAAGEARRLASRDERRAAVATVGRTMWLEAWDEAVAGVADLMLMRIAARLDAEARAVRMPRRRRQRLQLGAAEQGALAARLGSAGAGLVPALDLLEERVAPALGATALEREAMEAWRDALMTAARRLEEAWLELEVAIEAEWSHWNRVADEVARWRKPLWPVLIAAAVAIAGAAWLGLVMGGYIAAPPWLQDAWRWVFRR
ncbi:MAG: hypothetical protein JSW43_09830 [Gemmatimonadota bacterium]|nr:MAG: hypothetical protein JSW43_09830 [Gemmatimonadota bacterium]